MSQKRLKSTILFWIGSLNVAVDKGFGELTIILSV